MRKILYVDWEGKEISEFLPLTLLEVKDENTNEIPNVMFKDGVKIDKLDIPDAFASFFNDKVQNIVNDQQIDDCVYNGKLKINSSNSINKAWVFKMTLSNFVNSLFPMPLLSERFILQPVLKHGCTR